MSKHSRESRASIWFGNSVITLAAIGFLAIGAYAIYRHFNPIYSPYSATLGESPFYVLAAFIAATAAFLLFLSLRLNSDKKVNLGLF